MAMSCSSFAFLSSPRLLEQAGGDVALAPACTRRIDLLIVEDTDLDLVERARMVHDLDEGDHDALETLGLGGVDLGLRGRSRGLGPPRGRTRGLDGGTSGEKNHSGQETGESPRRSREPRPQSPASGFHDLTPARV